MAVCGRVPGSSGGAMATSLVGPLGKLVCHAVFDCLRSFVPIFFEGSHPCGELCESRLIFLLILQC